MQALTLQTTFGQILIPVSMVARIVGRSNHNNLQHSLAFVNSSISWKDYNIPLVRSSEMLGADSGSDDNCDRVVILWPMKGTTDDDLFALTSLESPRVININYLINNNQQKRKELIADDTGRQFILNSFDINGHVCLIPDLSLISKLIFNS